MRETLTNKIGKSNRCIIYLKLSYLLSCVKLIQNVLYGLLYLSYNKFVISFQCGTRYRDLCPSGFMCLFQNFMYRNCGLL